jgi:hypothetical protein
MSRESTYSGLFASIARLVAEGRSIGIRSAFPEIPNSSMVIEVDGDHFHIDDPQCKRQLTAATNWINQKTSGGAGECVSKSHSPKPA